MLEQIYSVLWLPEEGSIKKQVLRTELCSLKIYVLKS